MSFSMLEEAYLNNKAHPWSIYVFSLDADSTGWKVAALFKDHANVSLLIPDKDKQNQEDFIWALPIERVKWNKWYELSLRLKTVTPGGVRYVKRKEGEKVVTILIMPNEKQSDDDAMVACAWLRMVQGVSCRMYVVRCTDQVGKMNAAQLLNAVVGLDPDTIHEIDDPEEPDAKT